MIKRSYLEMELEAQFESYGLPVPQTEYKFMTGRGFRFDFAYPEIKMAIEVEGGIHVGGRHTRADGFVSDCIKYNNAACMGWYVLRVTKDMIEDGDFMRPSTAISFIIKMYNYLTIGEKNGKQREKKTT